MSFVPPVGRGGIIRPRWINVCEVSAVDNQAPQAINYFHRTTQNSRTETAADGMFPVDYIIITPESTGTTRIRVYMENAPGWTGSFQQDVDSDYIRYDFNAGGNFGQIVLAGRIYGTHVEIFGNAFTITAISYTKEP